MPSLKLTKIDVAAAQAAAAVRLYLEGGHCRSVYSCRRGSRDSGNLGEQTQIETIQSAMAKSRGLTIRERFDKYVREQSVSIQGRFSQTSALHTLRPKQLRALVDRDQIEASVTSKLRDEQVTAHPLERCGELTQV